VAQAPEQSAATGNLVMPMNGTRRRFLATALIAVTSIAWTTAAGQTVKGRKVLADFDDGRCGVFAQSPAAVVDSRAFGSKAARVEKGRNLGAYQPKVDWTRFNFLRVDAHNASSQPARLHIRFDDGDAPHGYYSWINRYVSVRPGRSTLELYLPALRRGEGSPKDSTDPRPFKWTQVQRFSIGAMAGVVEVDNIRLEKVDFPRPQGVLAFDFGPELSPAMPGTIGVTPETRYTDARGHGWTRKGAMWARRRAHPPDTFVGDWISSQGGRFAVKLPKGRYRVWLLWEDPGEWEFYQNYTRRSITAEGKEVVKETMNGREFRDRYSHFAETEDWPGDDIYRRYVEWRYRPRAFTVDVADGRLDMTIDGSGQYAATVNGMVIYPEAKSADGKAVIKSIRRWRRHEFDSKWVEQHPGPPAATAPGEDARHGFRLSTAPIDRDLKPYEALGTVTFVRELSATAARGEAESTVFRLDALKDLKTITLGVGKLTSAKGHALPADSVAVHVIRYKFKRIGFSGAGVYGSVPWLLVDGQRSAAPKGAVRTYWLTVRVPDDQAAGTYTGTVTLNADGETQTFALTVRVLPISLPGADMGLSMFGMGVTAPWRAYFPENEEQNRADRDRSLAYGAKIGFTFTRIGGMKFLGFRDGKAQFDFSRALAEFKHARDAGFVSFDLTVRDAVFAAALNDDHALARKHGFASSDALVKELFGAAIRGAKAAGLPEPSWCFGDEPPDTVAPRFIRMHKRMRDLAGARSRICWSPHGEPTRRLLDVTSICSLNIATAADFDRARKAGNTICLNNQGRSRWAYGLYMWRAHRAGVSVYEQFVWVGTHIDPYYPLDGHEDDGGHVFPDRHGRLRPVPDLLRIREGIDDYRYMVALERAITKAQADRSGSAARHLAVAEAAAAYVNSLAEKIRFEDTRRDRKPQLTPAGIDAHRAKVQEFLVKLADQPQPNDAAR